ncbi:MAG: small basic protein [Phycisphaerae bacterium]|nr:small basic protein [Phycisphaerae bacterium]|tara:strand:- start:696 stop:920 length:225 start_codon:yes stop_codon:yes gene_type:complete
MSLHRSLKTKPAGLNQHRNVLTRAERVELLTGEDKFDKDGGSPIGLPKVGSRKIKIAGKSKSTDDESGEESSED